MVILGPSTLHWVRNKKDISRHISYNFAYLHTLDVLIILFFLNIIDY